jgi:hypothetical protein
MVLRKLTYTVLGVTLAAIALCPVAQKAQAQTQQQDSIVDAARKAREQQKKDAKPAKVYTNEDITQLKGDVSVVGPAPAAPATGTPGAAVPGDKGATPGKAAAASDETNPKDEAGWRKKFADARKTLADDSKELDILQREFNLKQQQFYSDPNVALREQNSRKDLDDSQAQIDTKKADVAKDGQAISDLEEALRKAGGDPGWATEPSGSGASSTTP